MLDVLLILLAIVFFIIWSGFFAGSETGFMSANKLRLAHQAELGDKKSRLALKMLERPSLILGTTLVGTNIGVVSTTILLNILLLNYLHFPQYLAYIISTIGLTLLMLVFVEVIPKSLFRSRAESMVRSTAGTIRMAHFFFYPLTMLVTGFAHFVLWALGSGKKQTPHALTRDDIKLLTEISVQEQIIDKEANLFIHSVFEFGQTSAREIMTPLVDVVSIPYNKSVNAVVRLIEKYGFSRIPVYKEHSYTLEGYVSGFDLMHGRRHNTLAKYVRPALYVPETKRIDRLLVEMRQNKTPIVFVIDEWGGTAGIVTHEDIAEFIVGQIRDKGEHVVLDIQKLNEQEYLVEGMMDVDDLAATLDIEISKQGFETAAGFAEYIMQRIPQKGDTVEYRGFSISVEDADKRVVHKLRFVKNAPRHRSRRAK